MPLHMGQYIGPDIPPTTDGGGPVVFPRLRAGVTGMTWTTPDGDEWDLMSGLDGVIVCDGMTGIGGTSQVEYAAEPAEMDGQVYRGGRFGARPVLWPVLVWAGDDPTSDYTSWVERWNTGLSYDRAGVWAVTDSRGITRRLRLRLVDPGDDQEHDWSGRGWTLNATKLVADQPHWEGDPITRWFGRPDPTEMFEYAPQRIIRITSGSTSTRAQIDNPGQAVAWPVWTVYGPCDAFAVGVDGMTVSYNQPLKAGEAVRVDTTGGGFTAYRGTGSVGLADFTPGVSVLAGLSSWDTAPIPPGRSVPLAVTVTGGAGTVSCQITPLYWRGVA